MKFKELKDYTANKWYNSDLNPHLPAFRACVLETCFYTYIEISIFCSFFARDSQIRFCPEAILDFHNVETHIIFLLGKNTSTTRKRKNIFIVKWDVF